MLPWTRAGSKASWPCPGGRTSSGTRGRPATPRPGAPRASTAPSSTAVPGSGWWRRSCGGT
eukprot:6890910-Lingulodinium_polyedra.AAC.1